VSSYATEGRALERARPLSFRARAAARRVALTVFAALPRTRRPGLRIVHYHYVFDDEREQFTRQLAFLQREFELVSLSEAVDRLRLGRIEGDELAITFDDGFRNQLQNAAPALSEHDVSACFFVPTGFVGAADDEARRFCRERFHLPLPVEPLGWDDVRGLLELGHEIGSHTHSHPDLTTLDAARVEDELAASREELIRRFGAVQHFSAPYGERARFSQAIADAAGAVGYESCATAIRGLNTSALDVYSLRRHHLSARWPVRDLAYFLA
jgi:peptidoglycan/xylan/chitin deacetylase (PgdA/CDA1 family)